MRLAINLKKYFREHPEAGNYARFCNWCYSRGMKPGRFTSEQELESEIKKWKKAVKKHEARFEIKPWFREHGKAGSYDAFYNYCHCIRHIKMKDINSEKKLLAILNEWFEYERNKVEERHRSPTIKELFEGTPCEKKWYRFYAWHKDKYGRSVKRLDIEIIKERIDEYVRIMSSPA